MLDLADLEAHLSHDLVCPSNLIGPVSVYNVNVHGQFKGIAPELVGAVQAPVIVQANGERKGADAQTWPVLKGAAGLKDIWQVHFSLNAGTGESAGRLDCEPGGDGRVQVDSDFGGEKWCIYGHEYAEWV